MSSNETLIVPAPIIESTDMQTASAPMAEEQAYTYQRANGTVERARNAEDAIARCPVLGKLAIEAPDQANILLELAALGNAKLAAETKEEPKKPVVQEPLPDSKPAKAVEAEKKISESSSEQLSKIESSTIVRETIKERPPVAKIDPVIIHHDEYESVEKQQREVSLPVTDRAVEPNTEIIVAVSEKSESVTQEVHTERLAEPITNKGEPARLSNANNDETIDLATIISADIEQRAQVEMDDQEIVSEPKRITSIEDAVTAHDLSIGIAEAVIPTGNDVETIFTETDEPTLGKDEIVADLHEEVALLFEPETVEAYFEIRDLIANSEVSETIPAEITVPDIGVLDESETENELESFAVPFFETFLAAQPPIEEVTLESIKEHSGELPLEQTLVQLVEYLVKSTEDVEQRESIIEIIKDIDKAFPYCYIGQETQEAKLQITPEMTARLLTLLQEIGYQNPREALVNMIRKFGFEFLLQSLTYIYQLADKDNCKEFLSISIPASSSDDKSLSLLSKLLLKLVMGKELLPPEVKAA